MKIKLIVAHPRKNSLTFAAKDKFTEGAKESGHEIDLLDLYHDNFNPLYNIEDERDWAKENKIFISSTQKEMNRVTNADAIVFIFPIWWYSMPSIMKTYLDRVWNIGILNELENKKVLWLALAGGSERVFEKYDYKNMISHHLNDGIGKYANMKESRVEFLHDTLSESKEHIQNLLQEAYDIGRNY
ncbi:NAD(P)H oxidoreductase [Staphylococcus xylosus]|uniref:NAD(P)H oxidoreductase n=1 Tax=Staphylococcus xylosus TaxID=1288 RepID=UPI0015C54397|nr:NAD(P)H oxidoreductase [Staphylococcus xylosus]NQD99567.1 NAD(P)H oxidoreductase [Staphylococcus xylosus]